MKINWRLRLKNKTTCVALITLTAAIVYQVLGWFGITPKVEMKEVLDVASVFIEILALLGIVVDPTTDGISDSTKALKYDEPSRGSLEEKPELPEGYYEPEIPESVLEDINERLKENEVDE